MGTISFVLYSLRYDMLILRLFVSLSLFSYLIIAINFGVSTIMKL